MIRLLFLSLWIAISAGVATATEFLDDSAAQFEPAQVEKLSTDASMKLRDPASSQFRRLAPAVGSNRVICGQINGKNGFGGYAGFKPFFYRVETREITIYQEEPQNPAFAELKLMVFRKVGCSAVIE